MLTRRGNLLRHVVNNNIVSDVDIALEAMQKNSYNMAVQSDTIPTVWAEPCHCVSPNNRFSFLPPSSTLFTSVRLLYKYMLCNVKGERMQVLMERMKSSQA